MKNLRRIVSAISLIALCVSLFNFIGWPIKIRFNEQYLNYWGFAFLIALIPLAIAALAFCTTSKSLKFNLGAIAASSLIPCAIYAFFVILEAHSVTEKGKDLSFQLLSELPQKNSTLRLYLTDCGATCSFGLELRSEVDSGLGLKIVRPIWSKDRSKDRAELRSAGSEHFQVVEEEVVTDIYL